MPINLCCWSQCRSVLIRLLTVELEILWSALLSSDLYWSVFWINSNFLLVLISIGHWPKESCTRISWPVVSNSLFPTLTIPSHVSQPVDQAFESTSKPDMVIRRTIHLLGSGSRIDISVMDVRQEWWPNMIQDLILFCLMVRNGTDQNTWK